MGIASGVFWIVFGLLYILYKAFREHPDETVTGILLFGIIGGGIIAWHFIFHALLDWNIFVAAVFAIISFGVLIWYFVKINVEKANERAEYQRKFDRALQIAREEPIDEKDLAEFERVFWKNSYGAKTYPTEKLNYKLARDKSQFRDLIVKDYIENYKVYSVYGRLDREEKEAKAASEREEN